MARKGIYKRGDIWWIRYASLNGKIIRKSAGTDKYKEAEHLLHTEKKAVREGRHPEAKVISNHTFAELAEKYKLWMSGRQASADNKSYTIDHLKERFDLLPLRSFNSEIVEQLQTDLIRRGLRTKDSKGRKLKDVKGLKSASINRVISTIKHMFTKAVDWDMVEADVLKKVRKVPKFKEDSRLRFLSLEEARGLISVCDDHLKPIVVTALYTGMRKREILNLQWETNVDMQHGFVLLAKTKNGERREIPIGPTLKATFQSLDRRIDVPHVFYDPIKQRPYGDVKRSFASALQRAGITDFHFHDLRHTFASQLVMASIDLTTVKELLGHKDIKMTLRYAHLAPAHKRKAINVLDSILCQSQTTQAPPTAQLLAQKIENVLDSILSQPQTAQVPPTAQLLAQEIKNVLDSILNQPQTAHIPPTAQLLAQQMEKELAYVS